MVRLIIGVAGSVYIRNDTGNYREEADHFNEASDNIVDHGITHMKINVTVHEELTGRRSENSRQKHIQSKIHDDQHNDKFDQLIL
jgi:hypothetical protein